MTPLLSDVVNFCSESFQVTTWTAAACPSNVWFMDRLLGAANPPLNVLFALFWFDVDAKFKTHDIIYDAARKHYK